MGQGVPVAIPLSEHLPFDCIAITEHGLKRVSVKYRAANKKGVFEVGKRSVWADKHGSHARAHTEDAYDVIAIYCPDTKQCYFVKPSEFEKCLWLRVMGKGDVRSKRAEDFTDFGRVL